jgi:hypothetical protein
LDISIVAERFNFFGSQVIEKADVEHESAVVRFVDARLSADVTGEQDVS